MSIINARKRPACGVFDSDLNIVNDTIGAILERTSSRYSLQHVHQCVFQLCRRQCSSDLFNYLEETLKSKAEGICSRLLSAQKCVLLQELKAEWDDFSLAVRQISSILFYLNQNYTFHGKTIPQMGESIFCMIVLKDDNISATFVKCVQEILTSGPDTRQAMKGLAFKMRELCKETFYKTCVEDPLICVVEDQYSKEMEDRISTLSVNDYLIWVLDVIEKSKLDISDLLNDDAGERIKQNLCCLLIKQNAKELLYGSSGGSTIVRNFDCESMLRLGFALEKVNEIPALVEMAADVIKQMGIELFKEADHRSPITSVEKILELKTKAHDLLDSLPGLPKGIGSPVTQAFTSIVNSDDGFSEKLAHYYDIQVQMYSSKDRLKQIAINTFSLFRLIRVKDAFEKIFKFLLATRIINSKPEDSISHESILIEQLKKECGDSVANHFETMINDGNKRMEINRGFQRFISAERSLPIAFNVTLITAGVWPHYPNLAVELPQDMQQCASLFENYYLPRHNGRRICFHKNLGTVLFSINHGKRYELVAPTSFVKTILHLAIEQKWSIEQICTFTNLVESDVALQLESLSQMRLITATTINGVVKYGFNKEFSHPRNKLRLKPISGRRIIEDNLEMRIQHDPLEATRSMSIQSVVVRIMKSRKVVNHLELCNLVAESLEKKGFSPGMADIKKNLEVLINKGFISRGLRPDSYVYEC